MKCSCKSFDSSTYGKERLSEIIKKNVNLDSPPNNPKVTHILLQQCENLDLLLDIKYLDPDQYDLNVLSFVSTPELKLEFNQPRQSSLKLVVQDSFKTILKGTLEENQNNIEMFFRQVGSANFRRSEVIFENFFSRSSIHLLNFINIGNIIVDGSSIQSIDNFDARDPTNCFKIADDNSRVRVNCTRQELFYDNIRSHSIVYLPSPHHPNFSCTGHRQLSPSSWLRTRPSSSPSCCWWRWWSSSSLSSSSLRSRSK